MSEQSTHSNMLDASQFDYDDFDPIAWVNSQYHTMEGSSSSGGGGGSGNPHTNTPLTSPSSRGKEDGDSGHHFDKRSRLNRLALRLNVMKDSVTREIDRKSEHLVRALPTSLDEVSKIRADSEDLQQQLTSILSASSVLLSATSSAVSVLSAIEPTRSRINATLTTSSQLEEWLSCQSQIQLAIGNNSFPEAIPLLYNAVSILKQIREVPSHNDRVRTLIKLRQTIDQSLLEGACSHLAFFDADSSSLKKEVGINIPPISNIPSAPSSMMSSSTSSSPPSSSPVPFSLFTASLFLHQSLIANSITIPDELTLAPNQHSSPSSKPFPSSPSPSSSYLNRFLLHVTTAINQHFSAFVQASLPLSHFNSLASTNLISTVIAPISIPIIRTIRWAAIAAVHSTLHLTSTASSTSLLSSSSLPPSSPPSLPHDNAILVVKQVCETITSSLISIIASRLSASSSSSSSSSSSPPMTLPPSHISSLFTLLHSFHFLCITAATTAVSDSSAYINKLSTTPSPMSSLPSSISSTSLPPTSLIPASSTMLPPTIPQFLTSLSTSLANLISTLFSSSPFSPTSSSRSTPLFSVSDSLTASLPPLPQLTSTSSTGTSPSLPDITLWSSHLHSIESNLRSYYTQLCALCYISDPHITSDPSLLLPLNIIPIFSSTLSNVLDSMKAQIIGFANAYSRLTRHPSPPSSSSSSSSSSTPLPDPAESIDWHQVKQCFSLLSNIAKLRSEIDTFVYFLRSPTLPSSPQASILPQSPSSSSSSSSSSSLSSSQSSSLTLPTTISAEAVAFSILYVLIGMDTPSTPPSSSSTSSPSLSPPQPPLPIPVSFLPHPTSFSSIMSILTSYNSLHDSSLSGSSNLAVNTNGIANQSYVASSTPTYSSTLQQNNSAPLDNTAQPNDDLNLDDDINANNSSTNLTNSNSTSCNTSTTNQQSVMSTSLSESQAMMCFVDGPIYTMTNILTSPTFTRALWMGIYSPDRGTSTTATPMLTSTQPSTKAVSSSPSSLHLTSSIPLSDSHLSTLNPVVCSCLRVLLHLSCDSTLSDIALALVRFTQPSKETDSSNVRTDSSTNDHTNELIHALTDLFKQQCQQQNQQHHHRAVISSSSLIQPDPEIIRSLASMISPHVPTESQQSNKQSSLVLRVSPDIWPLSHALPSTLTTLSQAIVSSATTVFLPAFTQLISIWIAQSTWSAVSSSSSSLSALTSFIAPAFTPSPSPPCASIGESLLSLAPRLEDIGAASHARSTLSLISDRLTADMVASTAGIPSFTKYGLQQLQTDLEYLKNVGKAVGGSKDNDEMLGRLITLIHVLVTTADKQQQIEQQQQQQQHTTAIKDQTLLPAVAVSSDQVPKAITPTESAVHAHLLRVRRVALSSTRKQ